MQLITNFHHTEIEADKIVSHLDDLNYILTSKASTFIQASSTADARIVEKYTTLLAAFAKTGYSHRIHMYSCVNRLIGFCFGFSVPDFSGEIRPSEATYDATQRFIHFNERFTVDTKPFEEYELWDRLFPIEV